MDPVERQARIELTAALREAGRLGWQDSVCQHFSLMLPGSANRYLVNPAGRYWTDLRASELIIVSDTATASECDDVADVAINIHGPIHRARESARCVMHVHPLYATALGMIEGGRLEPVYQDGLRFYERVAYDDAYEGLATATDEGHRMADALGDCTALILANHGVVVVGKTVAETFDDLYFLERSARAQATAMQLGRPLRSVNHEVALAVRKQEDIQKEMVATLHMKAILKRLRRDEPEFEA